MWGKLLLSLAILSMPAAADIPPVRKALPQPAIRDPFLKLQSQGKHKGAWYMSLDGHAIFCYGPTMYVNTATGLQRVATFCRGDKVIVPLHE
jgi:hypothetical protein